MRELNRSGGEKGSIRQQIPEVPPHPLFFLFVFFPFVPVKYFLRSLMSFLWHERDSALRVFLMYPVSQWLWFKPPLCKWSPFQTDVASPPKGGSEVRPAEGHPSLTSLLILVTYSAKHAQLCVKEIHEVSVSTSLFFFCSPPVHTLQQLTQAVGYIKHVFLRRWMCEKNWLCLRWLMMFPHACQAVGT